MVERTEARRSDRPGTSPDAREIELDLGDIDNDDAPASAVVVMDRDEVIVDGDGQEWRFRVLDEGTGRVERRDGKPLPTWVGGALQFVGLEVPE